MARFISLGCLSWLVVLSLVPVAGAQGVRKLHGLDMGNLSLLMNPRICKEIEVVGEQQAEIVAALRRIQRVFNDREIPQQEKARQLREMLDKVNNSLLPHQHARLSQLRLRSQIQRMGTASALHGELGQELGLSAGQKTEIMKVNAELRAEMAEKIRKLREEARSKIYRVLTREQQKHLEELLGDPYEDPHLLPKY